ncbi:unnamed protein product [Prorocentrum cordatum]|uniref:Uncharacterized protein n=1 Tax=Prorocentrum cordatum TaxID=2364126 RepID=A0ABN9WWQ8_9DINO|nr:unnamed protein product [Polarella glacialis]
MELIRFADPAMPFSHRAGGDGQRAGQWHPRTKHRGWHEPACRRGMRETRQQTGQGAELGASGKLEQGRWAWDGRAPAARASGPAGAGPADCKTGAGDLGKSIEAAEAKIPQLEADVKSAESKKAETQEVLAQSKKDRADAKAAMAAATAQREKEAADFSKFKDDSVANIGAITKAVAALEKGAAGEFSHRGLRRPWYPGSCRVPSSTWPRRTATSSQRSCRAIRSARATASRRGRSLAS